MAQNDDSFIREVNEELRSEQLRKAWARYGRIVIAVAVLVVVATAGYRGYEYWRDHRASQSGDRFLAAVKLAGENRHDEAIAALEAVARDGSGGYPVLARLRAAAVHQAAGDVAAAIAAFSAVGADQSAPAAIRDLARLRAGWLMVDTETYEKVANEVQQLANPGNPLGSSAREALGLAAYRAGDHARAREWLEQISNDATAPRNVSARAQVLLDLIAASGNAASGNAPAATP